MSLAPAQCNVCNSRYLSDNTCVNYFKSLLSFSCVLKFDSHSVFDITAKRRRFSTKPVVLTEAQKQLMICHLPQVLRLHLKRFRLVVVVVVLVAFQLHTSNWIIPHSYGASELNT